MLRLNNDAELVNLLRLSNSHFVYREKKGGTKNGAIGNSHKIVGKGERPSSEGGLMSGF